MQARHCALVLFVLAACGDRSPPALWPEPPPPTLAKPIGIDEPSTQVATSTAADEPGDEGEAPTAPTSAEPTPLPEGRPPMPPLSP